ncbi:MAG TPA: arylsulfatase [Acidobacteriota bacterium]|nr:arylsulfatase [Acidobacteriota bacterium]HQO24424.1 arylsulfatase [Acidobacteriota bacterium]HQP73129.1 arylsulfatase [Acidobacteriota bacterium]
MQSTWRGIGLIVLLAATAVAGGTGTVSAADARPNILFIVADDLGWKDVGFNGSDIRTPSLDRLAAGGTRLGQFYAQPMCTPTRAALLTGRYPLRYGLQTGVIPTGGTYGLPTDEWLLPQALREAGYATALVGKWHLGHADRKYWPRQRGFDYQYGPLIGEIDYFTHECEGKVDWYRDNELVEEKGYSTILLGDDAVRYVRDHDSAKPFFLYLAFNAPHTPYQAPPEYLDRYLDIADPSRRAYAASITAMDDQVGRVVAELDRRGLRDSTLIVFMSDNGGTRNAMFAGAMADLSKSKIPCDNGPYREGKGTNYEGGTRVAAFANWPGRVPAGAMANGLLHVTDWYPTLARLAGASTARCKPLDGLDVWPAIAGANPSPRTEVVYNVEPFRCAVREGDWKLVWKTTLPQRIELFNIAQDPSEADNLADRHPDIVARLQRRANELATQAAKPMLLEAGFQELMRLYHLPPAFPGEEFDLGQEK